MNTTQSASLTFRNVSLCKPLLSDCGTIFRRDTCLVSCDIGISEK